MKLLHTFALVSLLAVFTTPVEAGGNNNQRANQQAQKAKLEREKERDARKKVNEEIKEFMADRDKNKNNQISREEFITGASEDEKEDAAEDFAEHDKNKDRSLSKSEIKEYLGLD
jgi:hypothetical protein